MDHLANHLPLIQTLYADYYVPWAPYIDPVYKATYSVLSTFYTTVYPVLYAGSKLVLRLISTLTSQSSSTEDALGSLPVLVILGIVILISFKVLDMLRRQLLFWISFVLQLALWGTFALVGMYVWQRGFENSIDDFVALLRMFQGLEREGERVGQRKAQDFRHKRGTGRHR